MPEQVEMVGTGSLRSLPDYRTVNLEHLAGAAPELGAFPQKFHVDYSKIPDLYQRKRGACTNHGAAEIMMRRELRLNGKVVLISPRFSYALCKIEDGLQKTDPNNEGTYVNMPFKIGVKYGFGTDAVVPNDTTLAFDEYIYHRDVRNMPAGAFEDAGQHKIPGYAQVGAYGTVSATQLMQALMAPQGQDGVAISLAVGSEWWTSPAGVSSWAAKDILPIRKCVTPESNHLVVATGFEIEGGTGRVKFFFRNHWSLAWGDQDTGWFYADQHPLVEAWVPSEIPDALLAIIKSLPSQKDFSYNWSATLMPGQSGPDVRALQIALKIVGTFPFKQAVTDYFGPITQKAVKDFQALYNVASPADIAAANGQLGPKTRHTLNTMFTKKQ